VSDIDTDEEFAEVLSSCQTIKCYTLKLCCDGSSIAFIYTKYIDERNRVVSLHGGGWGGSFSSSRQYCRGIILMVKYLLEQGLKVQTSCLQENKRAFRLMHSIGFVKYRIDNEYIDMWINKERLQCSKMYRYLYPQATFYNG
jgi:RimJ/RimL family protein N-acetyltransferase